MAQKTEKEETEFKVPETITLCVNNCGVTGNPAYNNMCQQCFNASTSTTTTTSSSSVSSSTFSIAGITTNNFSDEKASRSNTSRSPKRSYPSSEESTQNPSPDQSKPEDSPPSEAKRVVNRCSGCRRKVGLTGFRCRCGDLFCAEHRYSDRHDCSYDYKAVGREAIARENPVIKAAKIVKV